MHKWETRVILYLIFLHAFAQRTKKQNKKLTPRNCIRLNLDVTWAETGDRYMLKLFRDHLFHTVTENGHPWLDHAHIIQCLNKLDAGTMEKVRSKSFDISVWILLIVYVSIIGSADVKRRTINSNRHLCGAQALLGASVLWFNGGSYIKLKQAYRCCKYIF